MSAVHALHAPSPEPPELARYTKEKRADALILVTAAVALARLPQCIRGASRAWTGVGKGAKPVPASSLSPFRAH